MPAPPCSRCSLAAIALGASSTSDSVSGYERDSLQRSFQRLLPVFVYLAFPVVMYARPLAENRFRGPGINDLQSQLGLFWLSAQESLRAGEWPAGWTDALFAGMPFASNAQLASFYPLKFLMLLTPDAVFPAAFTAFIGLHFTIGSGGAHVLARSMGASRGFAMAAGLGYVASGWFVGHDTHIPILLPAAWLPWVLYGLMRATRSGEWMVGTSPLFRSDAGGLRRVQLILYAALASRFWSSCHGSPTHWTRRGLRLLGAFVGAGVVAGALGVGSRRARSCRPSRCRVDCRSAVGGAEFTALVRAPHGSRARALGALGGVGKIRSAERVSHAGRRARGRSSGRVLSANRLRAVGLVVGSVFFLL